jgi:hypothetical protein
MKSAKSGRIVGNQRVLNKASRGGSVHGAEEIYYYNTLDTYQNNGTVSKVRSAPDGWVKANTDPFYPTNMIHLDSIAPYHHIMKDYSGNSNDDFIHEQAQNRTMVPTRFGPAYANCWSTLFQGVQNGGGGYYSVDHYTNLLLSSGAFTIEFWMKQTATPNNPMYIISKGSTANVSTGLGWTVYRTVNNGIAFYDAQGNANTTTSGITLSADTWYHVAVVRNSTGTNDTRIYIDGQVYANGTSTGNFTDTNTMFIATDRVATTGTTQFKGNLTDIRISNSAKYSSVFARPNTPLDMTGSVFQMPISARNHMNIRSEHPNDAVVRTYNWTFKVIDSPLGNPEHLSGAGAHSIGSYDSARFFQYHDANPQNTPMRIGTSPFTIEAWIYRTQNQGSSDSGIISKGAGSRASAGNGWSLMVLSNGILEWHSGSTVISGSANTAVQNGGWYHVMAIREQLGVGMLKLYVNGQLAAVGTDNTNFTDAMMTRIGSARDYQYNLNGYLSTIRVSHSGFPTRYGTGNTSLANVTTNTASFVANTGTIDSTVKLLTAFSNTARPYTPQPNSFYTGQHRHLMLQYGGNDTRVNGRIYNNRGRGYSYNWWDNSTSRIVANSSLGDFSFASTQDFSVEFWYKMSYADYDGHETIKYLMDMQNMFKDSGLRVRWKSRNRNIDVSCNGRMMLVSSGSPVSGQWNHICIQRANNALALYLNGKKEDECIHSPAIAASNNRITFGTGSYEKGHYGNWMYGQMSDARVVKGSAAYAYNGNNPDYITLPKSPLTAIANTVLLTMNDCILLDKSGRNNTVTIGGEANTAGQSDGYLTSSWSVWPSTAVPYAPQDDWDYEASHGMNMVSDDVIHYARGLRNQESTSAGPTELSWLGRLAKPWTIEMVYYGKQVDPSSPGSIGQVYPESGRPLFRTGNSNTHQGLEFVYHYNGTNFVWGDQTMRWWNPQVGITANNTAMSSNSYNGINNTFKGHAFNHLAAVYDPSKINTFALYLNGKRVHANVGTFNSFTGRYDLPVKPQVDDFTTEYPKMSNLNALRISDNARYDTANTTLTIPTRFIEDANTFLMLDDASVQNDKTLSGQFMVRNVWPNYTYKKYGDYSWFFDNKRSNDMRASIEFHNHAYYTMRTMDPRYDDWTIECWASWLNTDSGGVAFDGSYGNCLFHLTNEYWVGVVNGVWRLSWSNGTGADSINFRDQVRHHQVNTSISVAQCSWTNRNNFDHICLVRKAGSTSFYINGIEQNNKFSDGHMEGWTADEGPTDNHYPDIYSQYTSIKLGTNWNEDLNYAWNGFVQDFRWSRMARYKTKVIQGRPTMVFADTDVAALPYLSNPYPTK